MRAVVFAYHNVGARALRTLLAGGMQVELVLTHPDDPGETIWFESVAAVAAEHGIPVALVDLSVPPELQARVAAIHPDYLFSFYFRRMLPPALLATARIAALNMHGSLLPKYRGRVPVNWAVLNGETRTGATLHMMVKRPDAGDIVDQEEVPIGSLDSAQQVFARVTAAARRVLERQIDAIEAGNAPHRAQDEAIASYFGGRKPEDGRIDWTLPAQRIFNLVRAVTHPYPGAFTDLGERRLFIWWALPRADERATPGRVLSVQPLTVGTGKGSLEIVTLQWQDGEEQAASAGTHGLRQGLQLGTAHASPHPDTAI